MPQVPQGRQPRSLVQSHGAGVFGATASRWITKRYGSKDRPTPLAQNRIRPPFEALLLKGAWFE